MTIKPYKNSIIVWQEDPVEGVAEKPVLLECYSDVITLTQGDNTINLNYETVAEFCKTLKKCEPGK
jgi:hypothetical protein